MTQNTICSILGLNPVQILEKDFPLCKRVEQFLETPRLQTKWKEYQQTMPAIIQGTNARLGFELEVVNILNLNQLPPLWEAVPDNSLRNYGTEFRSCPLPTQYIEKALFFLHEGLSFDALHPPSFSWRVSTHIHSNMQDLSVERFLFHLRLYIVFEPLFYYFAGTDRRTSNFCVPLEETGLDNLLSSVFSSNSPKNFLSLYQRWPKYSGLSLFRLCDYGTVEFRHFPGAATPALLVMWINLIINLYHAAETLNIEQTDDILRELYTSKKYKHFFFLIMKKGIPYSPKNEALLEQGARFIRHCFSPIPKLENLCPTGKTRLLRYLKKRKP